MIVLCLLLACAERAAADGAPPSLDGRPVSVVPAGDPEATPEIPTEIPTAPPVVVEVVPADPLPLELPNDDRPFAEGEGAVIIGEISGVVVDPALLAQTGFTPAEVAVVEYLVETIAAEVASRRPPGMGIPWYEKFSDEIAVLLLALLAAVIRRYDLREIRARDPQPAPQTPPAADLLQVLQGQVVDARQEADAARKENALLREAARRAAEDEQSSALASRPVDRLGDEALVVTLEQRGRQALR